VPPSLSFDSSGDSSSSSSSSSRRRIRIIIRVRRDGIYNRRISSKTKLSFEFLWLKAAWRCVGRHARVEPKASRARGRLSFSFDVN